MGRKKNPSKDPAAQARDKAMRLLGVRNRSCAELLDRLVADGFSRALGERILADLKKAGLVDDKKFACERAKAMGKGKGWGPRKLRADLIGRGVSEDLADEAVRQAYGNLSASEVMKRHLKKRFGGGVLSGQADRKLRAKAQRFLLQRGFEPDEVYALFN
jgi:regulatory protein